MLLIIVKTGETEIAELQIVEPTPAESLSKSARYSVLSCNWWTTFELQRTSI